VINRRFERLQFSQFRLYARPIAIFKPPMEISSERTAGEFIYELAQLRMIIAYGLQ
jgi:hypothetical protein